MFSAAFGNASVPKTMKKLKMRVLTRWKTGDTIHAVKTFRLMEIPCRGK
jgi:hypothetical protein